MRSANPWYKSPKGGYTNVRSTQLTVLGKKCYHDVIKATRVCDGEEVTTDHIRMKGIPTDVIYHRAEKSDKSISEIFGKLRNKESVEFDMLKGGAKASFKSNSNYTIESLKEFKRVIQFGLTTEEKKERNKLRKNKLRKNK